MFAVLNVPTTYVTPDLEKIISRNCGSKMFMWPYGYPSVVDHSVVTIFEFPDCRSLPRAVEDYLFGYKIPYDAMNDSCNHLSNVRWRWYYRPQEGKEFMDCLQEVECDHSGEPVIKMRDLRCWLRVYDEKRCTADEIMEFMRREYERLVPPSKKLEEESRNDVK